MQLAKVLLIFYLCFLEICVCKLSNVNVVRGIDSVDVVTKLSGNITFINEGSGATNHYFYVFEHCISDGYYIEFFQENFDTLTHEAISDTSEHEFQQTIFRVNLPKQIQTNQTATIYVNAYYTNCTVPKRPRKFTEDQHFLFKANAVYNSLYYTDRSETKFTIRKVEVMAVSKEPFQRSKDSLTFVFENVEPNAVETIKVMIVDDGPHLIVNKLERKIDVSHFGKITVEERVYIENYGPKLAGPYEPAFQSQPKTAPTWFFTHLPASAENVKYYDDLGNNSFSSIIHKYDSKTVRFRLRYPLISGWKSSYVLSYQVPTYEYILRDTANNFALRMRALDHVLNDVFVKDVEVKVLLPEGSVVREVKVPGVFGKLDRDYEHSGLSLFGRPMIVLKGTMLSEKHISQFSVRYFVSSFHMWMAPLLIAVYFEAAFISAILFRSI